MAILKKSTSRFVLFVQDGPGFFPLVMEAVAMEG
jgi:hypothetical protein